MPVLIQRFLPLVLATIFCVACPQFRLPAAQAPQTTLTLTPQQQDQLRDLAKRVLDHADAAGCKKSCSILVVNFADSSGSTTVLGMQLADAVSAQLAAKSKEIHIADRQRLKSFLEKERIASHLLEEDNAARWLAMENSANAVLVGYLKESSTGARVLLRVQLLDAHKLADRRDQGKEGRIEELELEGLNGALVPAEPFGNDLPSSGSEDQAPVLRAGTGGVSLPACQYCPTPTYTNPARIAKIQGTIVAMTTISSEGSVLRTEIVKGLPFGLNQAALQVLSSWTFRPATTSDGKPVTAKVPVDVTFRLY
jgi:TonB family protein